MKRNQIRNLQRQQGRRERLILPGYPEMVFRYQDVQFSEDYRMPREKFEVYLA